MTELRERLNVEVDIVLCDTTEGHKTCYIALLHYITLSRSGICSIISDTTALWHATSSPSEVKEFNCQNNLPFKPLVMITRHSILGSDCIDSYFDALSANWLLSDCSLIVLWVLSECSLSAHWVLTDCWLVPDWLLEDLNQKYEERALCNGRTDRQTHIVTPWAPVGAKNFALRFS